MKRLLLNILLKIGFSTVSGFLEQKLFRTAKSDCKTPKKVLLEKISDFIMECHLYSRSLGDISLLKRDVITDILKGSSINIDRSQELEKIFEIESKYWLELQNNYEDCKNDI